MLKQLRQALPEFEITKDGNIYDFKRTTSKGVLHIPAIITRGYTVDNVVKMINEAWGELNA